MCQSLMDLSMTLFCKDRRLVDAAQNSISAHPLGLPCENWVQRDLNLPASPSGKVVPVFVHVPNTSVNFTDVAMSRENPHMSQITIILVKHLIKELEIKPRDLAIVTPYKAQLLKLKERLGKFGSPVDNNDRAQLTTTDRVQGAERRIILSLWSTRRRPEQASFSTQIDSMLSPQGQRTSLSLSGTAKLPSRHQARTKQMWTRDRCASGSIGLGRIVVWWMQAL